MLVTERHLVIGPANVAKRTERTLVAAGRVVTLLESPDEHLLRETLCDTFSSIAIVTHDDVLALRYAMVVARIAPQTPLIATVFDHTLASRLRQVLPRIYVTSSAELAAPALAGSCVSNDLLAVHMTEGGIAESVVRTPDGVVRQPFQKFRRSFISVLFTRFSGLLRTPDTGTRMLVFGSLGVMSILAADFTWLTLGMNHHADSALLEAVSVVTTVGSAPPSEGIYAVLSALAMLATVGFTAMLTAGLVERILGPRLVGLIGSRVLPHSDHVIVVGLGQVGLRLCRELMALGYDVVGVERDVGAPGLRLARTLGIPAVVIGHGEDRRTMERLAARRARAVAVVGSDDLDNIATAVVAQAVAPAVRVVLRTGEHHMLSDPRDMLPLGLVRDVSDIAAGFVATWMMGDEPRSVVSDGHTVWVERRCGGFVPIRAS